MSEFWHYFSRRLGDVSVLGYLIYVSLLLAVSGPFGTFGALDFGLRLALWAGVSCVGLVANCLFHGLSWRWHGDLDRRWYLGLGLVFAVSMAAPAWAMLQVAPVAMPLSAPGFILMATAVSLGAEVIAGQGAPKSAAHPEAPPAMQQPDTAPALMSRLPVELRGTLHRIEVSDHYVVVHSDKGSARLLMRFADALREVAGADGLQVHRSHWVARAAITGVQRENAKMFVQTVDGARVPVSRTYQPKVRDLVENAAS